MIIFCFSFPGSVGHRLPLAMISHPIGHDKWAVKSLISQILLRCFLVLHLGSTPCKITGLWLQYDPQNIEYATWLIPPYDVSLWNLSWWHQKQKKRTGRRQLSAAQTEMHHTLSPLDKVSASIHCGKRHTIEPFNQSAWINDEAKQVTVLVYFTAWIPMLTHIRAKISILSQGHPQTHLC